MNPRLAIVIPYYKIKYFDACLKSLYLQTDQHFRVYIGDDNSPENPENLLETYKNSFAFYYKKFNDNLGSTSLTKQWDRCISLSDKEDWLMILGDDDVLEENFVEKFYKNLEFVEKENIKVIRFASQIINDKGDLISNVYENPKIELAANSYIRTFKGEGRSTLTEHVFTRKTYKKHGFKDFPVAFGSDNVAWLEFPDLGKIYSINSAKAFIRVSAEHLSSKKDKILDIKRKQGIYLFNRYIISRYAKHFSKDDQFLILKKAYYNLRSSSRKRTAAVNFIFFMMKYLPFSDVKKIIGNNRVK